MYHRTTAQIDLEYLPLTKDSVPCFLPPIIKFIEDNIDEEGIFRKNGSRIQVLKINEAISQHVPYIPEDSTIYDVASFLKMWLLKLPVPLIPPKVVATHYGPDITTSTRDILLHISYCARKCVAIIFKMLQMVLQHSENNHMTFQNLTTCFVLAFMQQFKDYPTNFVFQPFFEHACTLLNEDGTDFNLAPTVEVPLIVSPRRRNSRQCSSSLQRRNVGYIRKSDIMESLPKDLWVTI